MKQTDLLIEQRNEACQDFQKHIFVHETFLSILK